MIWFVATAPFMVLAVLVATVPLLVAMAKSSRAAAPQAAPASYEAAVELDEPIAA